MGPVLPPGGDGSPLVILLQLPLGVNVEGQAHFLLFFWRTGEAVSYLAATFPDQFKALASNLG